MPRTQKAGPTAPERFWAKTVPADDDSGCILWTGSKKRHGYGEFWVNGKVELAHRFAYTLAFDLIPDDLVLDHLCRNPTCVNAQHLEPVTQGENIRRGRLRDVTRARHLAQTECWKGHKFTPENTYIRPQGGRTCQTCQAERRRIHKSSKAVARDYNSGNVEED